MRKSVKKIKYKHHYKTIIFFTTLRIWKLSCDETFVFTNGNFVICAKLYKIKANNLNLEIFKYLLNILVTVELYGFQVYKTIKEHEKDRRASAPPVFSFKLRP
jgi:hypothetical protein